MTDLLIKLYDLPESSRFLERVVGQGITVRRARAYEKTRVVDWVRTHFGQGWADECGVAYTHQPISCFIATSGKQMAGFACYDCTCKGFFGPTGVYESCRRKGIGAALLMRTLYAMAESGYAYAVVGDGGAAEAFYTRAVEVQPISGSTPGFYANPLNLTDVENA
jgi:GNAT superfamily N-acetyltransferase